MLPAAFAGAAQAGLQMAGPPASAYYTWDETTKFTCGPSVAGGAATTALVKDPDGDDVGLGVRTAGGCKCVTTVRLCFCGFGLTSVDYSRCMNVCSLYLHTSRVCLRYFDFCDFSAWAVLHHSALASLFFFLMNFYRT